MPIVICRACKSHPKKAIKYVTNKEKATLITTNALSKKRSYELQFLRTAMRYGKGQRYDERKYYHIKISFEQKDLIKNGGKLDAELADKIADQYLQKQYGHHEYILATHIDKKHIHCHAIINAVSFETGLKIQHSNQDLRDMKDRVNDIAEQHGVSRFDWREAVKQKREKLQQGRSEKAKDLTQSEKYLQECNGIEWASSCWKETLRKIIDKAKNQCKSREELQTYLFDRYNITMPRNTQKTVSFVHPAVGKTVRGAKLGADYTPESIDQALQVNYERSMNHAELRDTRERTSNDTRSGDRITAGDNIGTIDGSNKGYNLSTSEPIASGSDGIGERSINRKFDEIREKVHKIREGLQFVAEKCAKDITGSDNHLQHDQKRYEEGDYPEDRELDNELEM